MVGYLYVVATPIGNLGDITYRAVETLGKVQLIVAEDTRHSGQLLKHLGIKAPLLSLHEYNEQDRLNTILEKLLQGQNIALISDAGTPLVSDPGYRLVHAAKQCGICVVPIPGPCALIAALSVSGLPSDRFVFEGFLPAKSMARRERLQALCSEERTLIFYESPHRVLDTLSDMVACFGGEREAVVARELTKIYETVNYEKLSLLKEWLMAHLDQICGEFVLLVNGSQSIAPLELNQDTLRVLEILLAELPVKQATALAAKITGEKKNRLYAWAVKRKS